MWMTIAILTLASSVWPPLVSDKRPPPVRVFVFTAPAGAGHAADPDRPAQDAEALEDSARDLREALRRKREFALVDNAEDAQLKVEVLNREERDAGGGGYGGQRLTPLRGTIVRLRVDNGETNGELKGTGQGSWKDAAKDAADRLIKWIRSHPPKGAPQIRNPLPTGRAEHDDHD
jgi:hypothetical protein